jgi:hypothetical protein
MKIRTKELFDEIKNKICLNIRKIDVYINKSEQKQILKRLKCDIEVSYANPYDFTNTKQNIRALNRGFHTFV